MMSKEETREYRRQWRVANPDKMAAQRARAATKIVNGERKGQLKKDYTPEEWRAERRKRAAICLRWRHENPEKYKAQRARNASSQRASNAEARRKKLFFPGGLFETLVILQGNACQVCDSLFTKENPACADHCHRTRTPRGLLCRRCNTAEGMISKTGLTPSEWAVRLEEYLINPPAKDILDLLG